MAQKQYTTYQADILSFQLRDALLGITKPGRYIGYNLMSQNTPPAGGVIVLDFHHTQGIDKYDQTHPTPVLEAERGVAVTTQGTIIAEDSAVTENLTFINLGSGGYHILYMEHAYLSGTPGANNATYGIKSSGGGASLPTLDYPTKQVIIGVIWEAPNGSTFADLTYYPYHPGIGDSDLYDKLFRSDGDNKTYIVGSQPSDGIIGNRDFVSNQYITDYQSLTEVLGDLDAAVLARAGEITTLQGTKLDDWTTPDNNTDLDATITEHGLLRKLSNQNDEFLNGQGNWAVPPGGRFVMRTGSFGYDVQLTDLSPDSNQLDFSGIASSDADVLILKIIWVMKTSFAYGSDFQWRVRLTTSGGYTAEFETHNKLDSGSGWTGFRVAQVMVPCDSAQKMYANIASAQKTHLSYIQFTCVGWQTYLP